MADLGETFTKKYRPVLKQADAIHKQVERRERQNVQSQGAANFELPAPSEVVARRSPSLVPPIYVWRLSMTPCRCVQKELITSIDEKQLIDDDQFHFIA